MMMNHNGICFEMKANPKESKTADIYIYDGVGNSWEDSDSNVSTAKKFREMLEKAGDVEKLNIHINSFGGACNDGVAIYSMIKKHKAEKTAYVDGYACSIATLIVAACDRVVMSVASAMMVHNALTFAYGNAKTMRAMADTLDVFTSGIKKAYLDRAGGKLTASVLDELMEGKDGDGTWISAEDCVKYGLCDEITGSRTKDEGEPEPEPKKPEKEPEPENRDNTRILNTFGAFML